MASSLAACLHSLGFEMPRVHDVAPLLDVDSVVEALTRLDLFTPRTDTMRSFFAQQDHVGVLNYVIDCLNFEY